jgi:NAD(P)-dependent dehydrogenase (short-subunit alcohol dehydrogenase family)
MRLENRRVLVIGASSGIGAASGVAIAAEGGRVAFAARRVERIEELARQAGDDAIAVPCDVRDEVSCQAAVERAVEAFGGLDALVYVPGISPFVTLREADAKAWREVLDTNLVGATVAMRAWQGEHKRVGFTTIAMGDTLTEFGQDEDVAALIPIIEDWVKRGIMYGRMMEASSVAAQVVNALASPETVRRIAITPHYPDEGDDVPEDWGTSALEMAREAQGK